jgi:hyperosmotically inducible protein
MAVRSRHQRGVWAVVVLAALLASSGCAVSMLKGAANSSGSGSQSQSKTQQGTRSSAQVQADSSLATAVRSRLAADAALKAFNIRVDAHDGVVTLRGQVDNVGQRNAAAAAARSVKGVKSVQNLLTIR